MKRQPLNDLYSSFNLWFNHTLLEKGEAYNNYYTQFYPIADDVFKNWSVYGSPFKQMVYDSSITGAMVPSGVYSNGNFIPRGQSGLTIDFNNGRVLFSGGINIPVSGQVGFTEFNVYATTKSDQELIFQNRINLASQFPQNLTGILSYKVIAPAIFIRFGSLKSDAFALGGQYNNTVDARAIILSDSNYTLDAIGNIFVNQKEKNFLVFSHTPLNEFGDLKTGHFNYFDDITQYYDPNQLAYLETIDFAKLAVPSVTNPDIRVGFLDFRICLTRFG